MKRALVFLLLTWTATLSARGLTADEQMRFADGIFLRGFYETAVAEYLALLRDFPGSAHEPAALYRTGECYRQMGNQAGAERFYKRVAAEYPGSEQAPRAELRRAEAALADARPGEAAAMLEKMLQGQPPADTAAAAKYYLGLSRWRTGDKGGADAAYARLLADHGHSPYAAYAALDLASLHAQDKSHAEQMEAWFSLAVEQAATPAAKAEALYRWGDWAYRQERYQVAADTLQSLLVEFPDERRAQDARLASAWSLYYLDRTAEALALSEKLVADAADAEAAASGTYLRANCLRKMNRDGEALADYGKVVRSYPGSPFAARAAYEIMVTHFKRGEYELALGAAPAQPESATEADVLWMRAESERLLGRTDLARGRYEILLQRFPRSPQTVPALLRLGEIARAAGRQAEAVEWFSRVVREYPRHEAVPEALKAAALARLKAGDAAGALADWDALLARKPDPETAAEARLQKALVQIELKDTAAALTTLDTLVQDRSAGPPAARAQYWRGVLFSGQNRWPEAETALRASLSAAPDEQTASLARLRLAVVLQRQDRMEEAAVQIEPLLADVQRVAENPALVEWLIRRRFDENQMQRVIDAATALARHAQEASWRQIGWYWVGTAQAKSGNDHEAIAAYEKAGAEKSRTREGAEARLLLAGLELKTGQTAKAAERFAAAAEAAGDDALDLRARAYFGLGETAEAAGQKEKAARHFMSVAVLFDDPEWTPASLYRAGRLYGQIGRKPEQAAAWTELRRRYPESPYIRQAGEDQP